MASQHFRALVVTLIALVAGELAAASNAAAGVAPAPDGATGAALLALDCDRLGADAVQTLARVPAPRIFNLQGSIPMVTMEPFARFLIGMGYPEVSLRDPEDGSLSMSSYADSEELAGAIAWYYERDGMRPMLVGHSQGGMLVVRTLHELAGHFHQTLRVYDPTARAYLPRTTIRDPQTHSERPVVGVEVAFAAAIATGTLPRVLLLQWSMIPILRSIPDTAVEFTGFTIAWDPIAGNLATAQPYEATGTAAVRNVLLPSTYSHLGAPITEHLAAQTTTRGWIDDWRPDAENAPIPDDPDIDTRNILHAADLWFSIRRHWCDEGQRRLRAQGRD